MATRTPSILISNFKDPQQEAFAKSVKAVTDYLSGQVVASNNAGTGFTQLQAEIAALQAAIAALQAQVAALTPTYICAGNIAKGQVVYESSAGYASVADYTAATTSEPILGIALQSGAPGAKITVANEGSTATGFTGLTVGPVYLGASGTLTSTVPSTSYYITRVGYAVDSQSVLVLVASGDALSGSASLAPTFLLMGA